MNYLAIASRAVGIDLTQPVDLSKMFEYDVTVASKRAGFSNMWHATAVLKSQDHCTTVTIERLTEHRPGSQEPKYDVISAHVGDLPHLVRDKTQTKYIAHCADRETAELLATALNNQHKNENSNV